MQIALFTRTSPTSGWRFEGVIEPGVGAYEVYDADGAARTFTDMAEAEHGPGSALAVQLPDEGVSFLVPADVETGRTLAGD